ncbi:hypothetical protein PR048_006844 [Dryococelus australis]|uniref:Uncharacterized protein n=1 Tax=Dryococelus australis TaxID=614101 RepID=A0ABQ9ICN9_9NEOP|nr:hypothetical protein PR048_006844 [Dryococelus australis]
MDSSIRMPGWGKRKIPEKTAARRNRPARSPHAKIRERTGGNRTRFALVGGEKSNHYTTARQITNCVSCGEPMKTGHQLEFQNSGGLAWSGATMRNLICTAQDHNGNTARLARRSDKALGVRVRVARIALSLLDLLGSPLVDDRPITNAVQYRVVSGVIWTSRTMVCSNTSPTESVFLQLWIHLTRFKCQLVQGNSRARSASRASLALILHRVIPALVGAGGPANRQATCVRTAEHVAAVRRPRCLSHAWPFAIMTSLQRSRTCLSHAASQGNSLQSKQGPIPAFAWSDFGNPWKTEIGRPDRKSNPGPPECESSELPLRYLPRIRGSVVVRLLASHQGEVGSIPGAGSLSDFRTWESCRTLPLVGGFSRGSPVSPALSFRRGPTLAGSLDLDFTFITCEPKPNEHVTSSTPIPSRATVAEWLARSPPTTENRAQSPAGSPNFRKWESCRMMPLVGEFSRDLPFPPALSFRRHSILTSITSAFKTTTMLRAAQISSLARPPTESCAARHFGQVASVSFFAPTVSEIEVQLLRRCKDLARITSNLRPRTQFRHPATKGGRSNDVRCIPAQQPVREMTL